MLGTVQNGRKTHPSAPRCQEVASRGIRTTADIADLGVAIVHDVLNEGISHKAANSVIRGAMMTLRSAELQHRLGNGSPVVVSTLDGDSGMVGVSADPLASEEARLLDQLASIRKERAAR